MLTRRTIIYWLICGGLVALIGGGVQAIRTAYEFPKNAYAMWEAGKLMVEHLKRNTNAWPAGWDDLERTYRQLEQEHSWLQTNSTGVVRMWDINMYSTFEEMRSRLLVDWNVQAPELAHVPFTKAVRPFRIVRLLNGKTPHWAGAEPNVMIWEYLHSTKSNLPPVRR